MSRYSRSACALLIVCIGCGERTEHSHANDDVNARAILSAAVAARFELMRCPVVLELYRDWLHSDFEKQMGIERVSVRCTDECTRVVVDGVIMADSCEWLQDSL